MVSAAGAPWGVGGGLGLGDGMLMMGNRSRGRRRVQLRVRRRGWGNRYRHCLDSSFPTHTFFYQTFTQQHTLFFYCYDPGPCGRKNQHQKFWGCAAEEGADGDVWKAGWMGCFTCFFLRWRSLGGEEGNKDSLCSLKIRIIFSGIGKRG